MKDAMASELSPSQRPYRSHYLYLLSQNGSFSFGERKLINPESQRPLHGLFLHAWLPRASATGQRDRSDGKEALSMDGERTGSNSVDSCACDCHVISLRCKRSIHDFEFIPQHTTFNFSTSPKILQTCNAHESPTLLSGDLEQGEPVSFLLAATVPNQKMETHTKQ